MSVLTANRSLAEAAQAHVRKVADGLAEAGLDPRFNIWYEGFGAGCTAGVAPEQAIRYLDDLVSIDNAHSRYRTALKSLTVSFSVREKVFSA